MLAAPGLLLVDNAISHAEELSGFRSIAEDDSRVAVALLGVGAGVLAIAVADYARATPAISGRTNGGACAILSCSTSRHLEARAADRRRAWRGCSGSRARTRFTARQPVLPARELRLVRAHVLHEQQPPARLAARGAARAARAAGRRPCRARVSRRRRRSSRPRRAALGGRLAPSSRAHLLGPPLQAFDIGASGSVTVRLLAPPSYSARFTPVPPPISITSPAAVASSALRCAANVSRSLRAMKRS